MYRCAQRGVFTGQAISGAVVQCILSYPLACAEHLCLMRYFGRWVQSEHPKVCADFASSERALRVRAGLPDALETYRPEWSETGYEVGAIGEIVRLDDVQAFEALCEACEFTAATRLAVRFGENRFLPAANPRFVDFAAY